MTYEISLLEKRNIDDALVFLNLSKCLNKEFSEYNYKKQNYTKDSYRFNNVDITEFHGAQFLPFTGSIYTPYYLEPNNNGYWFFDEEISPDVIWPIDIRTIWLDKEKDRYDLTRIHSLSEEDKNGIRKYFKAPSRYMLCIKQAFLSRSIGGYITTKWFSAFILGKWITFGESGNPVSGKYEVVYPCKLAMGIALTNRYFWRVEIGYEGHLRLSIVTDPTGIREIFKLRNIPAGKRRRAALRHWVRQHHRQNRSNKEADIFVRQHLRAETFFQWNGLECLIIPSAYDLELNERLREEREALRRQPTPAKE